jgi:hypothetical protein
MVAVVALSSFLLGLGVGWLLQGRKGKAEIARYREGVEAGLKGSGCWIRTQLPPGADPD